MKRVVVFPFSLLDSITVRSGCCTAPSSWLCLAVEYSLSDFLSDCCSSTISLLVRLWRILFTSESDRIVRGDILGLVPIALVRLLIASVVSYHQLKLVYLLLL